MILVVLLVASLLSLVAQAQNYTLPIRESKGIVYVTLTLNEKPANFMLDTGASISVLDYNQAESYAFGVAGMNGTIVGTGGASSRYAVNSYRLTIDDTKLGVMFYAMNADHIFNAHKKAKIVGLLGTQFFKFNNVTIDYASMTMTINKVK